MKSITLKRIAMPNFATYGVLLDGDDPFAVTIERPWKANLQGVSCIPRGTYHCVRVDSPKFGNTFEVTGVPNRSHILFHWGNFWSDSEGCVIVGEKFKDVDNNGEADVAESKGLPNEGFNELLERLKSLDECTLLVIDSV